MAEFESIRQIAQRMIAEHRAKKQASLYAWLAESPAEVQGAVDVVNEVRFDGIDREWLREMGILA